MSSPCRFPARREAVAAGWFSRRHETSAAHRAAQDVYRARRDAKAKREEWQRDETARRKAGKVA